MNSAVLLTAYGTPRSLDHVEAYYTHIRSGKKPSPAELEDLIERYRLIGGTSPLIRITEGQRDGLQRRILASGSSTKVYAGMKHSEPFMKDVVKIIADNGVKRLLCVALAPHYSRLSIGSYIQIVEETNKSLGNPMAIQWIESWHTNPFLIRAWCNRINEALQDNRKDPYVIFSAHSLPQRILAEGDPYKEQLLETSSLIAERIGLDNWGFAFQSASHTGEPWLGPDILSMLEQKYYEGIKNFIVAPIGFVSDHLEILYDIDVECMNWAQKRGVKLVRAKSLNDSGDFIECLFSIVQSADFL